jgi:tRNA pseudouridine55 synthase
MTPIFGLLNINKPQGPTSHDIVARVRQGTRIKKVGHAGTLDPMATGVLVLCMGPATRLSEYVMGSPKTYRARVRLGIQTDTYDAEGEIVAQNPDSISRETVIAALDQFRGDIEQIPPMYSAIKQGGKKLYNLARAGQDVERPARAVTIYRLDLTGWDFPFADLEIDCSPGTYIRSLAADLGSAVGVGAHLTALQRSASGVFSVENAVSWPDFEAAMASGTWLDHLLPPDLALHDSPVIHLDDAGAADVFNGRFIPVRDSFDSEPGDLVRAYDPAGQLIAVLSRRDDHWKPEKVFPIVE